MNPKIAERRVVGRPWRLQEARELYNIDQWGAGYFSIADNGHVVVHPRGPGTPAVDLLTLAKDLERRGLHLPILLRFSDILRERVDAVCTAFQRAIREYDYGGAYRAVMPIKVNQQRHVVEELLEHGRRWHLGLEAGSKPELLIALALVEDAEQLIVCNGYKDVHYIETAMLAQKLGRSTVIVVDRFEEVELIIRTSRRLGIRPRIGVRAKLAARGAGRWNESSGERSKFGLAAGELIATLERLRGADMLDCLQLLHFHIGSQITAIRAVKDAMREITRIYVDLCKLGAQLRYLDVGGGLAVDYDGSCSNFHSSMNYTLQEYANDVVWAVAEACREAQLPPPTLLSESGRALVAHHSVLLFNVLGVHKLEPPHREAAEPPDDAPKILHEVYDIVQNVTGKNVLEMFHDLQQLREESVTLFNHGLLTLAQRARCEELIASASFRILRIMDGLEFVPEELEDLPDALTDIYYCNFSLFQSLPDHWAVKHLFPIMPIHRLDERPTRRAVLVDLTCDSDGKIDKFVDLRDVKNYLPLHELNGEPYVIGAFLVGAYQETLGDLHNLFGDTNAVHVEVTETGGYRLRHVVEGDSVADVLWYVQYPRRDMVLRVRTATERAVEAGRLSLEEARLLLHAYETGLKGYTYLVREEAAEDVALRAALSAPEHRAEP
ncbi:MAG: biosynthetic arginine decarboxylase [Planctomycetota bacterium]|nr:MAG: biosynthetic arginine decarboxylase [Planctomycetota bacterium]